MDNNKANPWHKFIEDINDDQPVIVLENFKILQLNMQEGKTFIQENGRKIDWQEYIKKLDNVNNLCFMIRYSPFEKVEIYYDDLKLIDTLSRGRYTISRKPEKSKRSTQPH
jgi:hypothetical protein